MPLNLDARQRAMLQEMGITVWAPTPRAPAPAAQPATAASVAMAAPAPQAPRRADVPAPAATPARPAATTTVPRTAAGASTGFTLGPARPAYPQAAPAESAPWLVVAECAQPDDPFAGDAGRLLDNMLRALQLHRNPWVFIAPLVRSEDGAPPDAGLGAVLEQTQAALVLALGLPAARTVLGRSEPLGRLRASPQAVDHRSTQVPVVVTYDPAYLLRAPQAKASAWADLCRAGTLAAVR